MRIKVYFHDNPTSSDLWNWLHYLAVALQNHIAIFVAYIRKKLAALKSENGIELTILMSPTNKGKGIYKCCEVTCSKIFTLIQNRSNHEKKFKHAPVTRRSLTSLPQYNRDTKRYHFSWAVAKATQNTYVVSPGISKKDAHWLEKNQSKMIELATIVAWHLDVGSTWTRI